jgi:hypothetical protein
VADFQLAPEPALALVSQAELALVKFEQLDPVLRK